MTARVLSFAALVLLVAGCNRSKEPAPEAPPTSATPAQTAAAPAPIATSTPAPSPRRTVSPAPKPAAPATTAADRLDTGALNERRNPERVLRFYAAALAAKNWPAAAKAWGMGSGVTATTLKAAYDRNEPPMLEIGKGEQEGAAGSLYYEAPVALRFGSGVPERGSLVLRRVNDVDGATPAQLRWHIERSTIGQ